MGVYLSTFLKKWSKNFQKGGPNFFSAARTCDRFALHAKRSQALAASVDIKKP